MQNAKPLKFSSRMRWLLIAIIALLVPATLLLQRSNAQRDKTSRPLPDVVRMIGPVSQDKDLRDLPYIPVTPQTEAEVRLMRHPPREQGAEGRPRGPQFSERDFEREMKRTAKEEAQRERDLVKEQKHKSPKTPKPQKAVESPRAKTQKPRSRDVARVILPASRDNSASKPAAQLQTDAPSSNIASPTQTFAGMNSNLGCNGCLPPDTDGDVGPNHYVQSVNSSIRVHDKFGNVLAGPITYNSFFSAMGTSTPCGSNVNDGDGIVFYDHISDRWVVSDFAFPAFPGTSFYQCIGVSKTSDPVTGGYWLYAVQVDPANTNYIGDYPKFGLWSDGYYLSVNLFSTNTTFNGVRVYALDRASMINGGAANTIAFSILPADLGDQYSLVPATFRTGSPPPAGQPEWFMDVNSSAVAGTVETQVFVRRFHADFVTPANSFFGSGATHAPDGIITVAGFVDAFDATNGTGIVPNGTVTTTQYLDTLGDKLMYPLVYQNLGGVESVWSSHTVNNNQGGTGPTGIRWYQFNMTGNTIPATPAQQQTFTNGGDGLWRAMPSINVDNQGNVAIGYTASSATVDPGIRYAGRLAGDPLNTMAQGEAIMTPGTGHQTSTSHRWGDYSSMFVDPTDTCTFYHTNEYYSATSSAAWNTRVGSFKFGTCVASPLPTPTPASSPTPTPTPPGPPAAAGPVTVTASAGTVGPTDYATVKAAFDAINAGTYQGAINIFILGDTVETVAAVLNASGSGSASYSSIIMVPSGARTVSGNLATPLIDLNGADVVTIDGLNVGGNSLTLSNANTGTTSGTSTIRFINGAQNNTVKNCNIQGSSTVAVGTAGGAVLFSTSPASGVLVVGNNGNTISANNIGPAGANLPVKAISAVGTTTSNNTINRDNVIDGNNIFDFFGGGGVSTTGIDIRAGNHLWTIQNNRIYQTAPRTFTTTALRYAGITLSGTTGANGNAHTIRNNVIGFGAANGTGTTTISGSSNEFRGLDLAAASSGTATSVQGNIISGINQTTSRASTTASSSPFIGIVVGTTSGVFDVGNLSGNQIGSLDGSSTIVINETSTTASNAPVIAIYDFSLSSGNVSNNNIGAITINSGGTGTTVGFRGLLVNTSSAATEIINNNTIGGPTAAGAITDNQVGSYVMYGIQTALPAISMTGNTVRNMVGNSNFPATVVQSGYVVNVSTAVTNSSLISRNSVHSLSNASGAAQTSIYAMDLTLPATTNIAVDANVVERNLIHSISNTSTDNTSQMWGIVQRGSGTAGVPVRAIVKNNMIRLGLDAAGNSLTSGLSIIGIRDIQGATGGAGTTVVNYYFNSVYIGGTGVASSSTTFAFNGSALTSTRNYVDNIFWNARSNASGAGKNYAISVAGTAPNPAGLTMNYNDLLATGTGGFTGLFNAVDQTTLTDWRTATGQDANSVSVDPLFVNPNGSAATGNLHLQNSNPVIGAGTSVSGITDDFDGDARKAVPDIGADENLAVNNPPILTTNAGLTVANGATGTIDNTKLLVSDTDNTPNQLTFTVGTAPTHGNLKKGAATLSGGGTFTQADINSNLITYTHSGDNAVADSFTFTVSDGAGGVIGTTTFNITIGFPPVKVLDAKSVEPASGTSTMLFTVIVPAGAPAGGGSVQYATADSSATAGTCGNAGVDYQSTSGTLNFTAGQTMKTVAVTICNDGDANTAAPDETLFMNLSVPTNLTISTAQGTGTITHTNVPGTFIISELRTSGPGGLGDDFVELYNNANSPLTISASDASAGYGLYKIGADCNAAPVLIGTIPNGTVIPARGHYLIVGSQYSLANYGGTGAAAGNLTMSSDIESDRNVAVFSTANVANISSANRLDAVGYGTNTGNICDLVREGNNLAPVSGNTAEHTYFRSLTAGNPQDTNNNGADFKFADTQGTFISGIPQALGAPGPENLASPLRRDNTGILLPLIDGTLTSSSAPNRFRNFANVIAGTAPNGTLDIRRRVENTTGSTVTRLRFRIVDITTFPSPGAGTADLRVISSSAVVISGINDPATCSSTGTPTTTPCQVTAQATVLETPPAQPNGGGYNTTVSMSIPGGLANNASIDVNFQLGVVQAGTFRFKLIVEALP